MNFTFQQLKEKARLGLQGDPLAIKYAAWDVLDKDDQVSLEKIGQLETAGPSTQSDNDYWHPSSTITHKKYPYGGCSIYMNSKFKTLFFVYRDFGGHYPEMRCRYVDAELMII